MIQEVGAVREDLLVLVRRGAWWSSSKRRVTKNKSSRSVKQLGGLVMRGLELRSSMKFG